MSNVWISNNFQVCTEQKEMLILALICYKLAIDTGAESEKNIRISVGANQKLI